MSTAALTLRPATADDIPALHALVESAFRGASARRGWTHEADLLEGQRTDEAALAAIIGTADDALLVDETAGTVSGCVHLKRVSGNTAYLGMFTIAPARQGLGRGKAMLAAAEAHAARVMGARRMEMTVIRQRGELIAWYERRGYVQTGEIRPFPLDDPRFGLPLRRDLEFIVLAKPLRL